MGIHCVVIDVRVSFVCPLRVGNNGNGPGEIGKLKPLARLRHKLGFLNDNQQIKRTSERGTYETDPKCVGDNGSGGKSNKTDYMYS